VPLSISQYKKELLQLIEYSADVLAILGAPNVLVSKVGQYLKINYPKNVLASAGPAGAADTPMVDDDDSESGEWSQRGSGVSPRIARPRENPRAPRPTDAGAYGFEENKNIPAALREAVKTLDFDPDQISNPDYITSQISAMFAKSGARELEPAQLENLRKYIERSFRETNIRIRTPRSRSPRSDSPSATGSAHTLEDFETVEPFKISKLNIAKLLRQHIQTEADLKKYFDNAKAFTFRGDIDKIKADFLKLSPEKIPDFIARNFEINHEIQNNYKIKLLKIMGIEEASPTILKAVQENQGIIINLNDLKKQQLLNESFLGMFGSWAKYILKAMFGDIDIPVTITGKHSEVHALARALAGEKNYIDSATRYGLTNKQTYASKSKLDQAIKSFERETGIKWPFGV
jgi:hypothetical protein